MSRKRILASVLAAAALAAPITAGVTAATTAPAQAVIDQSLFDTKAEVNNHYWNWYRPFEFTPSGWTGSLDNCTIGSISSNYLAAQQNALNVVRDFTGLDRVAIVGGTAVAQTALMMDANGKLDHYPTSDWKCYSVAGDQTAAKSNLALYYPSIGAGQAISLFMDDRGVSNEAVGHRRWLLYPFATTFYSGATSRASAIDVTTSIGGTARTNPNWVMWPRNGWFPNQLDPSGRWSISSGQSGFNWSNAVVKVYKNGSATPMAGVVKYDVHSGYGMPTLVWQMPDEGADRVGQYKVVITGAVNGAGTAMGPIVYAPNLFTATDPTP